LFENWEQQMLRPVLVSLCTALLLFTASLTFAPVRRFFFPSVIQEYPLVCTVEPYVSRSREKLLVDVFILNRTDDPRTREALQTFLRNNDPGSDKSLSPDILLTYRRFIGPTQVGEIEDAYPDKEFNDGKGELDVISRRDSVEIRVKKIIGHALLKATVVVAGIPDLKDIAHTIDRSTKDLFVPLAYKKYEEGCYQR
jgi:hypothetical protein